ncbi:isochorismatase family protein [Oceanibacterium hippocampi]|uniref:Isochorismatase family protein n=1 Tax=Oceanibacterium hippocampi TaxID=745714 RepID=A0A1Y5SEY7_9PROT|nr:isochorismatase family protein [Oceanibacterium hippocampi]SLN38802.1 Isochorismatase family protein [Oceanibacterium hippocampi]
MDRKELGRALAREMPVVPADLDLAGGAGSGFGLVIVDEVNGFATVGAGNLAPPVPNAQVAAMVAETDRLARAFAGQGWPVLAFLDTHVPGKPEPPYPPHCEAGTGEEELVPELQWLHDERHATLVRKDCINGFVGATRPDGSNAVADWVAANGLRHLLVVGICTDICVMDFVLTALSARNHGMLAPLEEIHVYDAGCSTYDLPREVAESLDLPATAAHPQDLTHHLGLYFMASRGARLVGEVSV